MGLFSFVKNAGAKLFGKKSAPENSGLELSQADQDSAKAVELEGLVKSLGLEINELYVEVNDDIATVHGQSASLDDKEKAIIACGNVAGIAQVDDRIAIVSVEPEGPALPEGADRSVGADFGLKQSQFHTVQKGETLGKIAKHYYGNAMKYPVIFEANQPMLEDPNKIYPDQVLRIPNLA